MYASLLPTYRYTADIVVTLIVKSLLEVNTVYYKFTATAMGKSESRRSQ